MMSSMAVYRALPSQKLFASSIHSPLRIIRQAPTPALLARPFIAPTLFQLPAAIPLAIQSSVSSILSNIWESILRAVPKKQTSYRKKRQRFLAGKALKDVKDLNKCSACGTVKRAHLLCPYCVECRQRQWLTVQVLAD